MLGAIARGILRNTVVRTVVRGIGAGAVAGVGWKLGSELYDGVKKRILPSKRKQKDASSE